MTTKKVIGFHNPDEEFGFMSNWSMEDFFIDGRKYICVEQYMMYQKACLFNDSISANKILVAATPAEMKELGRNVLNFNKDIWDKNKYNIVFTAVYAKFSQNEELKKKLLETGDATLAEAALHDKIWGIGLRMGDPKIQNPTEWNGENLLGRALMETREQLRKENL